MQADLHDSNKYHKLQADHAVSITATRSKAKSQVGSGSRYLAFRRLTVYLACCAISWRSRALAMLIQRV